MSTFHERKAERTAYLTKYVYGWKLVKCVACNGSGFYDYGRNGKTPKCSGCDGTGKTRVSPADYPRYKEMESR